MSEVNRCQGPVRTPVDHEEEPPAPGGAAGGECKSASSQVSKEPVQTNDDPRLRDSLRTQAIDRPLEDDVIGNLIPGALVGGAGAAVGAGGASLGAMATAAAKKAVTKVAKGVVKHAVIESVKRSVDVTTLDGPSKPAPSASSAPANGGAGISKDGASVPVTEPNESKPEPEPPPVGQDRSPYAPGYAPIRIPEAPVVIRG